MKRTGSGLVAAVALSGAALAQTVPLPAWNAQDAFAVIRTLEPASMADCKDRNCTVRDGNLYETTTKGSFSANVEWSQNDADSDVRLYYTFVDCAPDKTGCKSLDMSAFYFMAQLAPDKMARWNAARPTCAVKPSTAGFNLTRSIPLSRSTTQAQLEIHRIELRACKARFDTFQ